MNRPLTSAELDSMTPGVTMTRRQKLLRLAQVIHAYPGACHIFDRLEDYEDNEYFEIYHEGSAFAVALGDKQLRDAGLNADIQLGGSARTVSVGAAKTFFELSRDELHAFSCNCGGAIPNMEMARRIESIAAKG